MVTRLHFECEGIPSDFPIRSVTLDQDYDFADVGGQQFLPPAALRRSLPRSGL